MDQEHIVKSFDEDLDNIENVIIEMGGLVEKQIADAATALSRRDVELAGSVIVADKRIDTLEASIDVAVVQILAKRQPMAQDLRAVVVAPKIGSNLERIGDYAKNIAKRATALAQSPSVKSAHVIPRMSKLVEGMIHEVLDAFVEHDADKAVNVWNADAEVDEMFTGLFRELLTYMMEDARNITSCTHLLFIAKNIERIGDHATNIAEYVYFLVHGTPLTEERPKGDTSPTTIVKPAKGAKRVKGTQ